MACGEPRQGPDAAARPLVAAVPRTATGMLWSEPDAMAFLSGRFAGKPVTGNCAA